MVDSFFADTFSEGSHEKQWRRLGGLRAWGSRVRAGARSLKVLALASTFAGCASEPPTEPAEWAQGAANVVVHPSARWTHPRAIPVCFVTGNGTSSAELFVRQLVTGEYAKAGLGFVGWGSCTVHSWPAIRVFLGRPWGVAAGWAGQSYMGMVSGPSLIQAFQPGDATLWVDATQLDWAAVHEFGHALGMEHEHGRTDDRRECPAAYDDGLPQGPDTRYLTVYDPQSVMSYCSGRSRLSDLDVQGLRVFYGTQGSGSTSTRRVDALASLPTFDKPGNNGTVSCDTYCEGATWGETGPCVGAVDLASQQRIACEDVRGLPSQGVACTCARPHRKIGNNGTVSCDTYCEGATWGAVGICVDAWRKDANGSERDGGLGCDDVPGIASGGVTCGCAPAFPKAGNNGTVSCRTYCESGAWPGGTGRCVSARLRRSGQELACNAVATFSAEGVDCYCAP